MDGISQTNRLLVAEDGVVHLPFLVKGRLALPPRLDRAEIEAAFAKAEPGARYTRTPQAQLVSEAIIDRESMQPSGAYLYQVLPALQPLDLIDTDFDGLARGPYRLPVAQVLAFLRSVAACFQENAATVERARAFSLQVSEHPDPFLNLAFASLLAGLDTQAAQTMIDNELSAWGIPGSHFLDGWVELPARPLPEVTAILARMLPGAAPQFTGAPAMLRAMPTRQLHITAGNAPEVPWISALRLLLSKSAGVVKMPFGATLSGALLALAAASASPNHPLVQHLSIVYWQGGDAVVEDLLITPGAFDRIVVWGAPEAVAAVQARAGLTKTVSFNPRYGASLIGREAFDADLAQVGAAAARDAMIYSQKSCTASLVQYIEADEMQARQYSAALGKALQAWDGLAPPYVPAAARGQLKRMKRGRYSRAEWLENQNSQGFTSGVVVMDEEFNILDHPMSRLVVVRPVQDLQDALRYLHVGVSTVGVYPEARRQELRDAIAVRGVSSILPLGGCERVFPGSPQDGMLTLSELVDWKVA